MSSASAANPATTAANTSSKRQSALTESPNIAQQGNKFVHTPTGYTWERGEDAPGYTWKSKKAIEEYSRAMDQIIDKEYIIGRRYGDIGLQQQSTN